MIDNYSNSIITIKRGDHVKDIGNGEYLGEVVGLETRVEATIKKPDGTYVYKLAMSLQPAPKLTPEEAWAQLPILILREVMNRKHSWNDTLSEDAHRAIRRECYKLLGGSGIKVNEGDIKDRVRNKIIEIAGIVGVYVIG